MRVRAHRIRHPNNIIMRELLIRSWPAKIALHHWIAACMVHQCGLEAFVDDQKYEE